MSEQDDVSLRVHLETLVRNNKEYSEHQFDAVYGFLKEQERRVETEFKGFRAAVASEFQAVLRSVDVAMTASEKAVTKAEAATEKRFDSVNEFRKTLTDQSATFLPRGEFAAVNKGLMEKIENLSRMQNMLGGALVLISFVLPIITVIITRSWK